MSKKKETKSNYLPMFFRLNFFVSGKILETGVMIDFNDGFICFSNSDLPLFFAKEFVSSLPDFFNIRRIFFGTDFDNL